jgi:hypothetical protein
VALRIVCAYVIAGRQSEAADLLSEINDHFDLAARQGLLEAGAAVRNLVKIGDTPAAMQLALNRPSIPERVVALAIIAEALAGLPGLPDETLDLL